MKTTHIHAIHSLDIWRLIPYLKYLLFLFSTYLESWLEETNYYIQQIINFQSKQSHGKKILYIKD